MHDDPQWLGAHDEPWRVESGETLHDNPWFGVDAFQAVSPTGAPAAYYSLRYKNAATGVVPVHEDGTLTLVGQWRFPFRKYSWELPEGGAPHGEDPKVGAMRELREEAGLVAADCRLILTMQLSNASSDERAYLYLATGLSMVETEHDATEAITITRVPFREALAAATRGRIEDSLTVASLLRVHHMAHEGELDAELTRVLLR
ncbi:NUDIX hydrolase [Caulobacter sp. S45]|uniref:NUDIX domain-containing protein n=1 Tax=Caulobacter sp. S45 TaxID=1641861 RepID=UPI00131DB649|nr:NUDIX hydrolase [Caulobacter sp. S45]